MCGLPGAGKTTLAKKLEMERKAVRFCPDEWVAPILGEERDDREKDKPVRDTVEGLLWKQAQKLLAMGVSVILENGFWSKEERDGYRDTAKGMGVKVELHFLDAPLDVLWGRVEKRNAKPGEFVLTREEMEENFEIFEKPTEEEGQTYDRFVRY